MQAAGALSGPLPLALRVASLFAEDSKSLRRLAALSGIVGSLFLRYGWTFAGVVSARDWRIPIEIDDPRS